MTHRSGRTNGDGGRRLRAARHSRRVRGAARLAVAAALPRRGDRGRERAELVAGRDSRGGQDGARGDRAARGARGRTS